MKIAQALQIAKENFTTAKIDSASLDAMLLLSFACGFSKEKIIFNPDLELSAKQYEDFQALVARRQRREPISHILNNREFYGLDFYVDKNVLDPRADSESLIELVLQKFPDKNAVLNILEIGVGSGCLVITLLAQYKNSQAVGVDISDAALQVAQKNAVANDVSARLQLQQSDLFSSLNDLTKFDLIISNPPYISKAQIEELADEVRLFEPRLALDGGIDGYDFYRRIAKSCKNFLKPQGQVVVEIGYDQKQEVENIFRARGFSLTDVKCDLAGVQRVLCFEIAMDGKVRAEL